MAESWRHTNSPLNIKRWFYLGGESDNSLCAEGYCELSGNADPRVNWNVLEIHDWPRFALFGANARQMIGAAGQLIFSQGTPVLYYGFEQGTVGELNGGKGLYFKNFTLQAHSVAVFIDAENLGAPRADLGNVQLCK